MERRLYYFSPVQWRRFIFTLVFRKIVQFVMNARLCFKFLLKVCLLKITVQMTSKPSNADLYVGLTALWKVVMVITSSLELNLPSSWAAEIQIWLTGMMIELLNKSHFWLFFPNAQDYFGRKETHVKQRYLLTMAVFVQCSSVPG